MMTYSKTALILVCSKFCALFGLGNGGFTDLGTLFLNGLLLTRGVLFPPDLTGVEGALVPINSSLTVD